ncbi:hypothetical protein OC846_006532 [Tilletia horrida]|uniref:Feruloyl esterase n=1 Tax=Tilletia horrida TaxID=155126 RepID=A0AAN6GJA6_9BASI|nr:hypothetical protein OC846_006532 [Tilletia horrida]KAK0559559.1 hypothetical protein OC861_006600 [Tilletia horrida]
MRVFTLGSLAALVSSVACALTPGIGTFTSATTGRWLYYDVSTDQIYFGAYSNNDPPATVFNITAGKTKGLYTVRATDNSLYVSAGNGSGVATATTKVPGTYNFFNFTQNSDGSFYFASWNGALAKTKYGAMDSSSRLAFTAAPGSTGSAVKFKWNPNPYQTVNGVPYRTFTAGTNGIKYNVSVFYPQVPNQMYAYSVKWIGSAFDSSRPMLMYLGGSDSRTNEVQEETDVLAKTQSTGFPKVVAANSTLAQALLKNYLLVVPASPTCYNTSTNSFTNNLCGIAQSNHFIKHYRPAELKRIYDAVQSLFGFDTTRFALVGTGMGGRGGLRFLIDYPTLPAAVSMVSGALETDNSTYIKALPYKTWDSGEGCWDVTVPNVGGNCPADQVVQPTMEQGNVLVGFPIRLWSTRYDTIDTLAEAQATCDAVNSGSGGNCTVIDTLAPDHQSMAYYSRSTSDVDWLLSYVRPAGESSRLVGSKATVTRDTIRGKRHQKLRH